MEKVEESAIEKKEWRVKGFMTVPFVTFVETISFNAAARFVEGMELTDLLLDATDGEETVTVLDVREIER